MSENNERLVSDMKVVVSDAEEILRVSAGIGGDKIAELREKIGVRLQDAKVRMAEAGEIMVCKTKAAAKAADDYVNQNPWCAVGIAVGIGFLLGVVICCRR